MAAVAGRAATISPPAHAVRLLVEIIEARPSISGAGCKIIDEKLAQVIDLGVSAKLATSSVEAIRRLAEKFAEDMRVQPTARAAITRALSATR
jgi:hypothetical protein